MAESEDHLVRSLTEFSPAASCWKKRTDFSKSPTINREPIAFFTPNPPASAGAETRQPSHTNVRGWPSSVMGSIS